ncbi:hypothetical protein FA13DRAFT_856876 [Coprinellus micaceus]|uniref:F-box domain-containing protein n=1 Tax=Coprinellus micaceus TaxID=71717 RepID=A0A4Y7T1A6_COPMI|nr:hypothetical protein FA13DRAFT_856876 [Coprinellus micaceus]
MAHPSSQCPPQPLTARPISRTEIKKTRINDIDREIAKLQWKIRQLESERGVLIASLDYTRNVPSEVLSIIFSSVLPEGVNFQARRQELIRISLVCKAWLNASYPLWAYLSISLKDGIPTIERLTRWFINAGATPKRIDFNYRHGFDCPCIDPEMPKPCPMSRDVVVQALSDLPTLHHVGLIFATSSCLRKLMKALKTVADQRKDSGRKVSWESITSLRIRIKYDGWEQDTRKTSVFNFLPTTLTSLDLDLEHTSKGPTDAHPMVYIPFDVLDNLTVLNLTCDWDSPVVLNILAKASNLTTLRLQAWGGKQTWEAKNRDVVLLYSVQSLHLKLKHTREAIKALPFLRFPNLRDFTLELEECYSKGALEEILNSMKFLSPDIPNPTRSLRSFTIKNDFVLVHISAESLVRTLRNPSMRSLEHLGLYNIAFDAKSLLMHGGERVLPNLKHLELEDSIKNAVPFQTLFDYVKDRQDPAVSGPGSDSLKNITIALRNVRSIPMDHARVGGAKKMREMLGVTMSYVPL